MTQPTALYLADVLEDAGKPYEVAEAAAAELRRLHEHDTKVTGMISQYSKLASDYKERIAALEKALGHYEAALKAAFPQGAHGEAFDHWNTARQTLGGNQ